MNISKLLLSTTLIMMSCSSIYATIDTEELCLNDFTIDQNNSNNNNCKHIWDLAIKGNELTEPLSNNKEVAYNTIILKDSGEVKTNTIKIIGDNSKFKGIIITPPDVKEVIFGENSFVRTININGRPLKYTFTYNNNVIKEENENAVANNNIIEEKNENAAAAPPIFKPGTKLRVGKK